jgi:hypothetical protein
MYALLSILFLFLVGREIAHGPESEGHAADVPAPPAGTASTT